eukprot:GFUD01097979.1.p1 GENE.GFUD01097979.1~~GFUD01097979.1.p1  ORF type:complete len:368 (+),score=75.96 GFUD01097979.1:388-1491(+)
MSEFKDRIRFLRDEFIQEDRRGSYNDFGIMKKQLIQEFFNDDPLFISSKRDHIYTEKQPITGPLNNSKQVERVEKHETHKDKQNVRRGSLENLYEKIRDLKSEFQHVEEKMRSAVEALPNKSRATATSPSHSKYHDQDWDTRSSRSWLRKDDYDDQASRSCKSDYYPGKFTEKLIARSPDIVNGYKRSQDPDSRSSTYSSGTSSRISSPTYPFLSTKDSEVSSPTPPTITTPVRGTTVIDLPFPDYGSTKSKSPVSDNLSGVSTPTYPFSTLSERSSCVSPESGFSDCASDNTIRPTSPNQLKHSETYIQIPVQKDKSPSNVEIGRQPLPSWELSWQKIRKNAGKNDAEIDEEKFGYEATIYEYRNI